MTDTQIITIAITLVAVMAALLYNNVRITDFNNRFAEVGTRFDRRIDDMRDVLRFEMKANNSELRAEMQANHSELKAALQASNSELKAALQASNSEFKAALQAMHADAQSLRAEVNTGFDAADRKLDTILHTLADHDHRITNLERKETA